VAQAVSVGFTALNQGSQTKTGLGTLKGLTKAIEGPLLGADRRIYRCYVKP
jgi:hypothetical protein